MNPYTGLMQSNATLKQHVSQLEEALAGRESTLVDMQTQMQQALKDKELESHQFIKRVQTLEDSLQKEKDGQRESRKQVSIYSSYLKNNFKTVASDCHGNILASLCDYERIIDGLGLIRLFF